MSIFKNLNMKQEPYSIALDLRGRAMTERYQHDRYHQYQRFIESIGEDGVKLLALKKHYEDRAYELSNLASSMRSAASSIDETIAMLAASNAWKSGHAFGCEDMLTAPIKEFKRMRAEHFKSTTEDGGCDNEEKIS